jgi:hypothetical protein
MTLKIFFVVVVIFILTFPLGPLSDWKQRKVPADCSGMIYWRPYRVSPPDKSEEEILRNLLEQIERLQQLKRGQHVV